MAEGENERIVLSLARLAVTRTLTAFVTRLAMTENSPKSAASIRVLPLGAGQDVGKSCVVVTLGPFKVMFDCGMHMGYNDARRFPDFSLIDLNTIDCVIITHFHLDHCGALPFLVGRKGYKGPVYMTHPTKAISPILLEDYRRIHLLSTTAKDKDEFFRAEDVSHTMQKAIGIALHEDVVVKPGLTLRAYYAGHVLGAAMFLVKAHGLSSVVYTGDFNTTPDRHLGAAWIDACRPDVMITESTYATTVRDSKRRRETQLLRRILACVKNNGKVLIPVFAVGRAQELCVLLDASWKRFKLDVPVYFSSGLTEKANACYRMFVPWTNEHIKREHDSGHNPFNFSFVKPWQPQYTHFPGAAVLFATPGMLHQGVALDVFRSWAPDPNNLILLPGYCVRHTVGWRVLNAHLAKLSADGTNARMIEVGNGDGTDVVPLRAKVENLSFSAHADATGIMQILRMANPNAVMLVHGEKSKMEVLKRGIESELKVPCFMPPNGTTVDIPVQTRVTSDENASNIINADTIMEKVGALNGGGTAANEIRFEGASMVPIESNPDKCWKMKPYTSLDTSSTPQFTFKLALKYEPRVGCCATDSDTPWRDPNAFKTPFEKVVSAITREIRSEFPVDIQGAPMLEEGEVMDVTMETEDTVDASPVPQKRVVRVKSVSVEDTKPGEMTVTWNYHDEGLACRLLDVLDVALA